MLKKMKRPIICYKRSKRPNRSPVQRLVARPKCHKLYYKYRSFKFIIDDESYFTLWNANLSGNDTFYSSDRNMTEDSVKYYDKAKYEDKLLVWVAISPAGMSKCFIVPSKMAVNQKCTWKKVWLKGSFKNIIVRINMYFGPIWLHHIMQIRFRYG